MRGLLRRIADTWRGAQAGVAATAAMSLLLLVARRAGISGQLPPRAIVDTAAEQLPEGSQPDEEEREAAAGVAHFLFGAAAGALFGLATSGLRRIWLSAVLGLLYGSAVYVVSYMGWIPSLGILPPSDEDRPGRVATMVGGHWVYGATLGIVMALARRRRTLKEQARQRFG
jgi:hypothetical protein